MWRLMLEILCFFIPLSLNAASLAYLEAPEEIGAPVIDLSLPSSQPKKATRSAHANSLLSRMYSLPARLRTPLFTVVIDPGHGGHDAGAKGWYGVLEKEIVLNIAKRLARKINREAMMRAFLTRTGDYFVPLRTRLKLARHSKADIFIAIHADAYYNNTANGASVFALSNRGATSESARWLAEKENYSELGEISFLHLKDQSLVLRSVLIDLAQVVTVQDSLRLGTNVLKSLENITRLHYTRVERAPFVVLKSPDIPSILVEVGFISEQNEEKRLLDPKFQEDIADALWQGIYHYHAQSLPVTLQDAGFFSLLRKKISLT